MHHKATKVLQKGIADTAFQDIKTSEATEYMNDSSISGMTHDDDDTWESHM